MLLRPKRSKRNSLILLFLSFFLACTYAQAAQDVIDQKETAEEVLDVAATIDSEKPASEGTDGYIYDPRGKTDPFKSFIAVQEETEEERKRPRTYLETVELSQLQLTVIITSKKENKENWAMVRDSKGDGHVIKKGTYIGTNGGIVHEIRDKEVIIREEYKDFRGNIKYRERTKRLPSLM